MLIRIQAPPWIGIPLLPLNAFESMLTGFATVNNSQRNDYYVALQDSCHPRSDSACTFSFRLGSGAEASEPACPAPNLQVQQASYSGIAACIAAPGPWPERVS